MILKQNNKKDNKKKGKFEKEERILVVAPWNERLESLKIFNKRIQT